ncbi:hypothetical protein [Pseudophaeobacter arcticus]|jgi:hypothetical protein
MNKLRQATRKIIVERVGIIPVKRGEAFFPSDLYLKGNEDAEEA